MNEQKRPVHNGRKTTLGKYTLPVLMMLLASLVVFAGCAETPLTMILYKHRHPLSKTLTRTHLATARSPLKHLIKKMN